MVEAMVALVRGGLGVVGTEQGNPQLAGLDHQETIDGIGVERLRQAPDHIVKADQQAAAPTVGTTIHPIGGRAACGRWHRQPHLSFM